ncbi:metallophosphoesterase [Agrobacterium radiobacter]|uniref:metallophosphoesterase n=1 Tax=Agrobacterium radiobacter TaxID=362 RepID=UPI003418BED4
MASEARFLILTDLHLAGIVKRDEIKSPSIPKIENPSRIAATGELLSSIADYLRRRHLTLEAVIFAGDAQDKGSKGSHEAAYQSIVGAFQEFGIDAAKIVSTPGNHDVLKGSPPGSTERYADFASVWRDNGCVVPWIDGLDPQKPSDTGRHRLVADDAQWAIYPLNTSNWSQVRANVPSDLATVWEELPKKMAQGNGILEEQVKAALGRLLDYDMANISNDQLKVFRQTVDDTPQPTAGSQVRLAVMHHHLRSPSFRVEYKPFEGITNLEQLRSVLKETNVAAAIHGHKHEHNFRYEYVESNDPDIPHRIAVVSAGTFQDGADHDAAMLLTLKGLPYTPEISVERIDLPRIGLDLRVSAPASLTLLGLKSVPGAPVLVQGSNLDELYALAARKARAHVGETLIVHYEPTDAGKGSLKLPSEYPRSNSVSEEEMQNWLEDLVKWWQLERSSRDNDFPYPHGSRLRLFGGKLNQIDRIVRLLSREPSSRALAVLVDPLRDFDRNGEEEAFPSFTMMQVRKRETSRDVYSVDVIGFYRAQEFSQWWPVNMAELRLLQSELADQLKASPGMITTVTTDARFKPQGPGQVSVPVFDRWVDQSPEKLFMLALTLSGDTRDEPFQRLLLQEWVRSLNDIKEASSAPDTDGVLIPAEGLRTLVKYLSMIAREGDRSGLVQQLQNLLMVNQHFQLSRKLEPDRQAWSLAIERIIPAIIELTPAMTPH